MKRIFTTNIFTERKFGFLLVASMFLFSLTSKAAPITWKHGPTQSMSICQNAPTTSIDTFLTATGTSGFTFTWTVITAPAHGALGGFPATAASGTGVSPTGTSFTPTPGYSGSDVYVIQVSDGTTNVTTTVNLTINPSPVISGTPSVCVGATTVLTSSSGGTWTSSNSAVATTPSSFGFVKGISPGTSIITYTNTSGCMAFQTVTVKVMPSVIIGASSVCQGSTTYLSDLVSAGTWSSPDATVNVVSNAVTGVSVGTATISYNVAGCVVTGNMNVLDVPNPIVGPSGVCMGNIVALTDYSSGGVWSSSNTTITTVDGFGNVSGLSTGTATISYTTGGICSQTTVITVDPPLPAIIGAGRLCVGATINLSNAVTTGTWSSLDGDISVDINTGDVTGIAFGSATITYAVSSGCLAFKSVTINPNPNPISLTSAVMCYGDMTNFATDSKPGGTWTSALVTVSTGGFITAYATGSGMLTYTLITGCSTTTPITVNSLPGVISGPNKICTGSLYALGDTSLGGTWSTTDVAVLVDMYSGALYGNSAGTAVVTYLLPTGCELLDTITVFDSPTPILGSPNVCIGGTTKLSDAVIGGTWDISAGGNASILPSSGLVTGLIAGAAAVTYTTGNGCSITIPLTVWALPAAYTVTGGGDYCIGGSGVAVGLSGSVAGVRYYLYNGIALVDSIDGSGLPLNFGLRTSGGFYSIVAKNKTTLCENNMTGTVTVNPLTIDVPIANISVLPGDTVCEGTPVSFTVTSLHGGLAPGIQWKVNGSDVGTGASTYSYTPVNGDIVGVELTSTATCVSPLTAFAFVTMTVITPIVPVLVLSVDPGVNIPEGGTPVTFTATITNVVPAPAYQWIKNGVPIPGEVKPTYFTTTIADKDTISCRVFSGGKCSMTSIERLHMHVFDTGGVISHVGVENVTSAAADIRVLPNPSKGVFSVKGSTGIATDESVSLEMTNLLGQVIYNGTTVAKDGVVNAQVQLNNVANGTYLLNVRTGAMHKVFHIIIEQ